MNNSPQSYILNRVDALEATVGELRQAMTRAGLLAEQSATLNEPMQLAADTSEDLQKPASKLERSEAMDVPSIASPASGAVDRCPACGAANLPDAPLCTWCGEPLPASLGLLPVAAASIPVVQRVPARHDKRPSEVPARSEMAHEVERVSVEVPSQPEPSAPRSEPGQLVRTREPFKLQFDVLRKAEFWLNKVGIVLFLFGVVFLFRYAVDNHWLNEQARVGAGLLLGSILLGFGMLLHAQRRHLSQVLLGGAIATYYITGYAAYNIFPTLNVPYEAALAYMTVVTTLAFLLSLWHGEAVLALIGVVGGLLTPFALGFSQVEVSGLIMYTTLIVVGTSAIYLRRGWRAILWCAFAGGAANLLVAHSLAWTKWGSPWWSLAQVTLGDRMYLQAGIIVGLFAFWVVPMVREVLWRRDPARWQQATLDKAKHPLLSQLAGKNAHLLSAIVPLLCLVGSWGLWSHFWFSGPTLISWETWGLVSMLGAAVMLGAFLVLRRVEWTLGYLHALLAVGLLTLAIVQLLEGDAQFLAFAAEGLGLLLIARRTSDRGMELCGHALFGVLGLWIIPRRGRFVCPRETGGPAGLQKRVPPGGDGLVLARAARAAQRRGADYAGVGRVRPGAARRGYAHQGPGKRGGHSHSGPLRPGRRAGRAGLPPGNGPGRCQPTAQREGGYRSWAWRSAYRSWSSPGASP
jgi:hypothetical protein